VFVLTYGLAFALQIRAAAAAAAGGTIALSG